MARKKIVAEKANRLYQLPPELSAVLPERRRPSLIRKADVLDLATFNWPARSKESGTVDAASLAPADSESLARLREEVSNWYLARFGARLNPEKEI